MFAGIRIRRPESDFMDSDTLRDCSLEYSGDRLREYADLDIQRRSSGIGEEEPGAKSGLDPFHSEFHNDRDDLEAGMGCPFGALGNSPALWISTPRGRAREAEFNRSCPMTPSIEKDPNQSPQTRSTNGPV